MLRCHPTFVLATTFSGIASPSNTTMLPSLTSNRAVPGVVTTQEILPHASINSCRPAFAKNPPGSVYFAPVGMQLAAAAAVNVGPSTCEVTRGASQSIEGMRHGRAPPRVGRNAEPRWIVTGGWHTLCRMTRSIAMLVALALPGCAFLFQEHVSSEYAYHSEPRCTTSPGWYVLDGLMAAGDAAILFVDDRSAKTLGPAVFATALVSGLIHFGSMVHGYRWADECDGARREYDLRYAPPQPGNRISSGHLPVVHVGFFCASSPTAATASMCKRNESTCEHDRAAALTATPDIGACELADVAYCFDVGDAIRCSGTTAACAAQRDEAAAMASDSTTIGACAKAR